MGNSDVFSLQHSGLNDFLFAAVGTEANGTSLSLLSVFARLGADPWREAGRLAGLPKRDAIDSLARTIAEMPTSAWTLPDATTIATRLIALLPARASAAAGPGTASTEGRTLRSVWIGMAAAGGILLLAYTMGFLTTGGTHEPGGDSLSTFSPGVATAHVPADGGASRR